MKELAFASIKTIREKIQKRELSPREYVDFCIKRFETFDSTILSALEIFKPETFNNIERTEGPLGGIPGLIKDNICQKNRSLTCASKILAGFVSPYDATAVRKLKNGGAIPLGRANCDEFAMGASGETSAFQKTKNPWDQTRVPGGSSSGSAAAVAAGLVPWALGSETGGSVRQPAALCGIVGSKPTYGLVSRYGLVAYGSSLDQIGVCTRTVHDNALVLGIIAGMDDKDSTALPQKGPHDYVSGLTGTIRPGLKIGVVTNALYAEGMGNEIKNRLQDALRKLEELGAELIELTLPAMDYGAAVYFMISRAEAASNLARFDGVRYGYRAPDAENLRDMYELTRGKGFGREVRRRILLGNYVLSAGHADQYYASACAVRRLMRAQFLETFKKVDLLFLPTSPAGAFKFDAFADNPLQMDLQDYFTAPSNLVGMPAVSVPCGFVENNLPVGFQLAGPDCSEALIFQTAYAYEQATEWHAKHPDWLV
ncbi:MAG: Asp-tRNA(Asn)/Glu-tRNA(Gln) amidotransferase subunit GatA [Candidatus Babeliaceae bacterium]|nr:Asp-tRNA(Asn)/Glu-tRNA(Gln) amidotransferase subunit GatA [Candidatus Babeliaceae bacterium]